MSTTPHQAAPRALFTGWVDDAAVFPPGSAPVPQAWHDHLQLLTSRHADLVGPLLLGTGHVRALLEAVEAEPPREGLAPVAVAVVARAGTPVDDLLAAVDTLRREERVAVTAVEVAHDDEGAWRRAGEAGVPVAVEVPREPVAMAAALDEVGGLAADLGTRVVAKLRTQGSAETPAPTARELAEFMILAKDHRLPFKLTGGLHRAVADPARTEPHGALNALVGAHHAIAGAGFRSLEVELGSTDGGAMAYLASTFSQQDVEDLRATFVSFGCCGVTDPLHDLEALGLLPSDG